MKLDPPFTSDLTPYTLRIEEPDRPDPLLPASYRHSESHVHYRPSDNIAQFLSQDLSVARLSDIHDSLWLAGRPLPPRPLSFQLAVSRQLVLDERVDMHLVWDQTRRMHFKPLPRYLLNLQFWTQYICTQPNIYPDALGFLYSYIALIEHESDFTIAQSHSLIPTNLPWSSWVALTQQTVAGQTIRDPAKLSPRYRFGELRLSRLNLIYRYQQGYLLRGYEFQYQTYAELISAYIAPLSVTTIYFVLVLTAMQVGLATEQLGQSAAFHAASWGFAVVSIVVPLGLIMGLGVAAMVVFIANFVKALRWKRESAWLRGLERSPSR